MNDLLTSASLLVTLIGIFVGLWHEEFNKIRGIEKKAYKIDNKQNYSYALSVLKVKAFPLTISCWIIVLIFMPDALHIVIDFINQLLGQDYLTTYDAVSTAYVFVVFLTMLLGLYLTSETVKIFRKMIDLNGGKDT